MSQRNKVSVFDLKFFGSDFMKIKDDNLPLITNIPQTRRQQIPKSLNMSYNYQQDSLQTLEQQIRQRIQGSNRYSKSANKVQKLRSKIEQIKILNHQKHKDILDLYNKNTNDLLSAVDINKKQIKKIRLFDSEEQKNKIKIKQQRQKNQEYINNFYNNIGKQNEAAQVDYKKRLVEIQATLKNSQIPKKVEDYLVSKNMRIPKFLKQLKS